VSTGVHLRLGDERADEVAALSSALGGRVGVAGVLADLNRSATPVRTLSRAVTWAFGWDDEDARSRRWWPQGITSTADRDVSEEYDGRRVLCTSWYSQDIGGVHKGSRVSFVDLAEDRPRYRHVLLVEPVLRDDGTVDIRPVRIHAGGLAWYGDHLHVAGTARGIYSFRLDDIVRADDSVEALGYRYLLPVRFAYEAVADDGVERLRYSFLSLARGPAPRLVAGEYGRRGRTTRLLSYPLDPATSLLSTTQAAEARPSGLPEQGLGGMQGAVVVDDTWYVSTSSGRYLPGSLHVGRPGAFRRHAGVLPVGVEDLSYWPSTDTLWTLSEYPGRRSVVALDRARFT
jgi:hypothetical protein